MGQITKDKEKTVMPAPDKTHIQRVSALTKEVTELHPLLDRLLPTLPTVLKVEYKQGPNEMGADFVLQRMDPALEQIVYVGVIAKITPT